MINRHWVTSPMIQAPITYRLSSCLTVKWASSEHNPTEGGWRHPRETGVFRVPRSALILAPQAGATLPIPVSIRRSP